MCLGGGASGWSGMSSEPGLVEDLLCIVQKVRRLRVGGAG